MIVPSNPAAVKSQKAYTTEKHRNVSRKGTKDAKMHHGQEKKVLTTKCAK
jgi:hypothetical protein